MKKLHNILTAAAGTADLAAIVLCTWAFIAPVVLSVMAMQTTPQEGIFYSIPLLLLPLGVSFLYLWEIAVQVEEERRATR